MDFSEYFIYDTKSKTGLVWNYTKYTGSHGKTLTIWPGKEAGWISKYGYGEVKLEGKCYKCHRIIWELFNGKIPEKADIDHIDGNRLNNDIENLRLCNDQINAQNRKKRYDNMTGVTGVKRQMSGKVTYYTAFWTDFSTGAEMFKCFSDKNYGDEAFELAIRCRQKAIESQRKAGAYYTKNHGEKV